MHLDLLDYIWIFMGIIIIARFAQEKWNIPTHITYLLSGQAIINFTSGFSDFINGEVFNYILLIVLPFLIANDVMSLSWKEIKKNALSIFLLAIVNVLFTAFIIVYLGHLFFPDVSISVLVLVAAMIAPTDPAGVAAALFNFLVPHSLKFKLETESLANDVAGVILYSISLGLLLGDISPTPLDISIEMGRQLIFVFIIAVPVGYAGLWLLSKTNDAYTETFLVFFSLYFGFIMTDHHTHVSGIFAVIVIMLIQNEYLKKLWKKIESGFDKNDVVHPDSHNDMRKILFFIVEISNAVLFIAVGSVVNYFDSNAIVWEYMNISIYVFIVLTFARAIFMGTYAYISKWTEKIVNTSFRWWSVLVFGGMKGGISIYLLFTFIQKAGSVPHMDMIIAIVYNVVFLVTFVYTPILIGIFSSNKDKFKKEYDTEIDNHAH